MKINGSNVCLSKDSTLFDYLLECGFDPMRVAVERNGEIVPKNQFATLQLTDEDTLEVVSFVGGG